MDCINYTFKNIILHVVTTTIPHVMIYIILYILMCLYNNNVMIIVKIYCEDVLV